MPSRRSEPSSSGCCPHRVPSPPGDARWQPAARNAPLRSEADPGGAVRAASPPCTGCGSPLLDRPPRAGRDRGAVRPPAKRALLRTRPPAPSLSPRLRSRSLRDRQGRRWQPLSARRAAGWGSGTRGAPAALGTAGLLRELRAAAGRQEGRPEPRFGQKPNAGRSRHEIPADRTPGRCRSASGLPSAPLGSGRSPAGPAGVSQCPGGSWHQAGPAG